jgi:hypothetical protein
MLQAQGQLENLFRGPSANGIKGVRTNYAVEELVSTVDNYERSEDTPSDRRWIANCSAVQEFSS